MPALEVSSTISKWQKLYLTFLAVNYTRCTASLRRGRNLVLCAVGKA
jgi:hypothetical protein